MHASMDGQAFSTKGASRLTTPHQHYSARDQFEVSYLSLAEDSPSPPNKVQDGQSRKTRQLPSLSAPIPKPKIMETFETLRGNWAESTKEATVLCVGAALKKRLDSPLF